MKRILAIMCAAMLCVCCLALAACGDNSSSPSASSGTDESSGAQAADPGEKFVGEWKFAALESQGVTISGDLSAILGTDASMGVTLAEDGMGSMTLAEDTADLTWELSEDDANAIVLTTDADGEVSTVNGTYDDGALSLEVNEDGVSGTAIFTADGTLEGLVEINVAGMEDIASEDALVGDWTLCGANVAGMVVYGDAESVAALSGGSDTGISIEGDGTASVMGSDATWTIGSDGAVLTVQGAEVPVKALGDDIAIDISEAVGVDMILVFAK